MLNFDGRGISLGRGQKFSGYKEGSGSTGGANDKESPANARDIRDVGSIFGWGKSPGGGNSNPFQYSRLENPMDRGAWWDTVHGVTKNQT